jgi:CHAT domain-containing protein
MGLTRAFLGCGVRSLLVTLWPVYEIPTRILIEHFYGAWREGASKASALVGAQRYLMQMESTALEVRLREYGLLPESIAETIVHFQKMLPGGLPFAHPYYWGAFLLIGDPE